MGSSAAVAHLLRSSTSCAFRDNVLHGYSRYLFEQEETGAAECESILAA